MNFTKMKKLSVIIPAYNEENRITEALLDVDTVLSKQSFEYEILVINDGSKDNTVSVVSALQKDIKNLVLIDNDLNHGKGWAIKEGMHIATGDIRLFMDADNSTRIEEIFKMLPYIDQGFDVVIGSRYIQGSHIVIKQPWGRVFFGKIFRIISHILIPVGVNDLVCGFKIFTEKSASIIFPKQTIFGWAFDIEILMLARKNNLKIKEIPVTWRDRRDSDVKVSGMMQTFIEMIQIRFNLWFD